MRSAGGTITPSTSRARSVLVLVAVLLAVAVHLDWHLARSSHHGGLSFGWRVHWILALPVFALTAWYVHRAWPGQVIRASAWILGLAGLVAQVLEPLAELATGATLSWTFGPERLGAFLRYMSVGILTQVIVLLGLSRTRRPSPTNG